MNETEQIQDLRVLRSTETPRPSRRQATGAVSRRDFLTGTTLSALTLATGGASTLLTGCGSHRNGELKDSPGIPTGTRLAVSTFLAGTIEAFRIPGFESLGTVFANQGTGITTAGIVSGPGDNLFIFSPGSDRVFLASKTNGVIRRLLPNPPYGLITPHSGTIGPDGVLYVVNAPTLNGNIGKGIDSVEKYDATTGDHIGTFTTDIRGPFGITFGPDGDAYISSTLVYGLNPLASDYVARYDGKTGAFKGYVVRNIKIPFNLRFHPDGYLLVVAHFDSRINMYNPTTGKLIDSYADVPFPVGMTFGPDGHLYVGSFSDSPGFAAVFNNDFLAALGHGRVMKFDGKNGKYLGDVATGLPFGGYVAFI